MQFIGCALVIGFILAVGPFILGIAVSILRFFAGGWFFMFKLKFKKKGSNYKVKLKLGSKKLFKSILNLSEILKRFWS